MKCPYCKEEVPLNEYSDHYNVCPKRPEATAFKENYGEETFPGQALAEIQKLKEMGKLPEFTYLYRRTPSEYNMFTAKAFRIAELRGFKPPFEEMAEIIGFLWRMRKRGYLFEVCSLGKELSG